MFCFLCSQFFTFFFCLFFFSICLVQLSQSPFLALALCVMNVIPITKFVLTETLKLKLMPTPCFFFASLSAKVRTPRDRIDPDRVVPARAPGRTPQLGNRPANHHRSGQRHGLAAVNVSVRASPRRPRPVRAARGQGQGPDRAEPGR